VTVSGVEGDLLVAAAGVVGGAVNAVAGGGTLITFPVLLATGQSALSANITSSVGLLAGYSGGSLAYRRELAGQRGRFLRLALPGVIGGVTGALLLLATPKGSFRSVVPYLVLFACALLLAQPWLSARLAGRTEHDGVTRVGVALPVVVFLGAVYGGYFGAVLGVVLLAVLGLLIDDGLQRLNALKGVLSLTINVAAVVVFLISARVAWVHAGCLAAGALVGGVAGVRLARRLPAEMLRYAVAAIGTVVAAVLIARG
jgi:uncharacterized membrane protein YfcA